MICRTILVAFSLAYLAALGLLLIGTFGLFGAARDPLAGVYVIILGLPWVRLANGAPASAGPALVALSPAINLAILWFFCSFIRSRRRVR